MSLTFVEAFEAIILASGRSKTTWAEWLGVTNSILSSWLEEEYFPTPRHLYMFVMICREFPSLPKEPLRAFSEMASQPARKTAPKYIKKAHPSIGHYIMSDLRESFVDALTTIPPRAQEELLLEGIARCNKISDEGPSHYDLFDNQYLIGDDHGSPWI